MMCYRDKTFCSQYIKKDCVNHNCVRAYTPFEREEASKWWGSEDVPVCIGDLKDDNCGYINA